MLVLTFMLLNRWPEIMEHKDDEGHTPMQLLIEHFPESAELLMDHCIKRSEMKGSNDPNFTVTCDFRFLDPGPDDTTCLRGHRFFGPRTMAKHQRRELLFHPLTQVLLNKKWFTFGRFFYFNFLFYLVFVGIYTAFLIKFFQSSGSCPEIGLFIPITSCIFILLIKEIIIICIQRFKYFTVLSNLMEWVLYGTASIFTLTLGIVCIFENENLSVDFFKVFLISGVTSIFLCYANLALFLRRLLLVGIYVTMFIEVTKTVLKVLLIFLFFFFGFSIVFVIFLSDQVRYNIYYIIYLTKSNVQFEIWI